MERRRLTLIAVPHDKLNTKSIEISYRLLRILAITGAVVLVFLIAIVASWWYMAAQVYRVRGLENELQLLEEERERVEELSRTLAELEAQYARVRQILGVDDVNAETLDVPIVPVQSETRQVDRSDVRTDIPGSWPLVQAGFITQEATGGEGGPHPGIDIAVPQDSYIRTTAAGVVSAAGFDDVYGGFVLIRHAEGYETMYGHASQVFVAPGDTVEKNEVVALSGSTGRSTAPHLHFEIRKDGVAIDPLPLLRKP